VIVLGAAFLAGQAYEWISLFREGVGVKDVFGTPFFSITGIHGTHVFVGLLWAAILLISRNKSVYNALHQSPVEMFGLYWHFVDIVWIVLFTVIYLI
jgi:heme/copper-type cytochrome/quinol oxidase subunit 3